MFIKFKMRQDEIDSGVLEDSTECPVAKTIKRELGVVYVSIFQMLSIDFESFATPKYIFKWIIKFDRYKKIKSKPLEFYLNIPKKTLEKMGYFEQKSNLFPETLITTKDRNETGKLPQETKHKRHQMVEEQSH